MSEDAGATTESLFKPNKRRKTYRRRNDEDEDDAEANSQKDTATVDAEETEERSSLVKRPTTKKRGINFSSTGRSAADATLETSLVPYEDQQNEEISQTNRFIKPSSGVRVVEDKHLTAYVDSKLAELRSSTTTTSQPQADDVSDETDHMPQLQHLDPTEAAKNTSTKQSARDVPRKGSRPQSQRRRRRYPPPKDETSIARESMVDQILAESQVPMYDRSAPPAPKPATSSGDADEAAAEAFKAEFLAGLAERHRRRPAAAAAGTKGAHVSNGPKLGGSRSQREKMKALEEAKKAVGGKK